jgi:phage terminase large subunit-like protein
MNITPETLEQVMAALKDGKAASDYQCKELRGLYEADARNLRIVQAIAKLESEMLPTEDDGAQYIIAWKSEKYGVSGKGDVRYAKKTAESIANDCKKLTPNYVWWIEKV